MQREDPGRWCRAPGDDWPGWGHISSHAGPHESFVVLGAMASQDMFLAAMGVMVEVEGIDLHG